MKDEYINLTIGKQKRIALIAHDSKKRELVEWVKRNSGELKKHFLCGTGTTARLIAEEAELPVRAYNSGPLGGDLQVGAKIVEGTVDMMVFFWDRWRHSRMIPMSRRFSVSQLSMISLWRTIRRQQIFC